MNARANPASSPSSPSTSIAVSVSSNSATRSVPAGSLYISIRGLVIVTRHSTPRSPSARARSRAPASTALASSTSPISNSA